MTRIASILAGCLAGLLLALWAQEARRHGSPLPTSDDPRHLAYSPIPKRDGAEPKRLWPIPPIDPSRPECSVG
jgi:hypothetical protein